MIRIGNPVTKVIYPLNRRMLSIARVNSKSKRLFQTITTSNKPTNDFYSSFNYDMKQIKSKNNVDTTNSLQGSKWNPYKINGDEVKESTPLRRSRASRFKKTEAITKEDAKLTTSAKEPTVNKEVKVNEPITTSETSQQQPVVSEKPKKKRRVLKPRKAIITLSPNAVEHLKGLMDKPDGKFIRIGVQNRGCSGLTYHLEYVNEAGKFDELVEQDGVKVFIDSKALFSIVGSEMDWLEDKLSSRFIFKNPNSKGTCGCGESFMV